MAWEVLTIRQIYERGDELTRTPLVIVEENGKRPTSVYLVDEIIFGEDGSIIVNGAHTEFNEREQLDQNTKVLHFCV